MNTKHVPGFTPPGDYGVDVNDSRFFVSFGMDEVEKYLKFFEECGFVVIRDVLSEEDCDATVDEIWKLLSDITSGRIVRNDPNTWEDWPTRKTGILGSPIANDYMAWKNRQSKNIHRVFSQLYGTEELLVSIDRYNIMRPTKTIDFGNGDIKDRSDWKGLDSWFHWDLNPWYWTGLMQPTLEPEDFEDHGLLFSRNLGKLITEGNDTPKKCANSKKLQGLVALDDTSFETGGFQCIPGFVGSKLKNWAQRNMDSSEKYINKHFVAVPKDDSMTKYYQVIGLRKGSMIVWSSELPHCNRTNNSSQFRYCQYIKMIPRGDITDLPGRSKVVATSLARGFLSYKTDDVSPVLGLQYRHGKDSRIFRPGLFCNLRPLALLFSVLSLSLAIFLFAFT